MTKEIRKEWEELLEGEEIYIYGAGKTAERLFRFIEDNFDAKEKVKGFLVSDKLKNPEVCCGLPVIDVHECCHKTAVVWVPHVGIFRKQISSLLEKLNFEHVFYIGRLLEKMQYEGAEKKEGKYKKIGWEIYDAKTEEAKAKDKCVREKVLEILQDGNPDFGGFKPYQSMEWIGLEGVRPSSYRIREYGLKDFLDKKDRILDIGCNSGFLDMLISGDVQEVTGIEYDASLVHAADTVKEYLGISNCMFYNEDFKEWYKRQDNIRYNVIFSFAIHHWLNLKPEEYIAIIDSLLLEGGYVCFESHLYGSDIEFDECCQLFMNRGYRMIRELLINDSEALERKFVLFQKSDNKVKISKK